MRSERHCKEEDIMRTYQFRHREDAAVYAGVSDDLHIAVSVRGMGAELACRTAAEMILQEGRMLLDYPERKLAYLLSEQLRLAMEVQDTPIRCAISFAAADEDGGRWLFAAGGAAAYHCSQQKLERVVQADGDFPECWENAVSEKPPLFADGALAVSADPAAVRRLHRPLLDKLHHPELPKSVMAQHDYSYAVIFMEDEEAEEHV